jgi:type III restriction enzyme
MALHAAFPDSPHAILDPELRWFPADETLHETNAEKLMPPLVVEVDHDNKDADALDIEIPVLTPRVYREYKNLSALNAGTMPFEPVNYRQFSESVFNRIIGDGGFE